MSIALIFSLAFAIGISYFLFKVISSPVTKLMNSVRGGILGLNTYENSNVVEIDELHDVIEELTEKDFKQNQELVEDLIQIITVFSCRLQDKRANKVKKIIKDLLEDDKNIKNNANSK